MTPEERAARERKQKIFVVVGGLLLVGLLAIQLPKLMGGGGSGTPAAAATETTSTVPGATSTPAAPATAGVPTPGAVTAAAAPPTAKLTSFTVFKRKDPFVQQVVAPTSAPATPSNPGTGAKAAKKTAQTPTKSFTTGGNGATAASATIVNVNGTRQVLVPGTKFPAADPLFVLVAEKPGVKAIVVGIVGGAYSGGSKTTALKVGKPVTLVNTATGAKYTITLVSVGNGAQAAGGAKPSAQPNAPQAGN